MNRYQYRVTALNPGNTYTPSAPDTLYVADTHANDAMFVNPPLSVCSGSTQIFSATGGLADNSLVWTVDGGLYGKVGMWKG